MAFTEFPRELDDMIAGFMTGDCRSLGALCLVSKYCRAVAEPCLYRHVVVHGDNRVTTKDMLITLVDRIELASNISIVDIDTEVGFAGCSEELNQDQHDAREEIASRKDAIQKRIKNTLTSFRNISSYPTNEDTWYHDIETFRFSTDATATLIICMAPNIQHLGLHGDVHPRCMLQRILRIPRETNEAYPLCHLKSVRAHTEQPFRQVILLTSMTTLELNNISLSSEPFVFPTPKLTVPLLHTLILTRMVNLVPEQLELILECDWFVNLEKLVVDRAVYCYGKHTNILDSELESFVDTLSYRTPLLERFEWINHGPGSFKTFKSLPQLRELRLIRDQFGDEFRFHPSTISAIEAQIPDSLQSLTLEKYLILKTKPEGSLFSIIAGSSETASDIANDLVRALSNAFVSPASSSSLRHLKLTVRMETTFKDKTSLVELHPAEVATLRYVADELAKVGFIFEVHRMPGRFEKFYKPLIKPGWTATLPHSRRLDQIDYVYHPAYLEPSMFDVGYTYGLWDVSSDVDDGEQDYFFTPYRPPTDVQGLRSYWFRS